SCSEGRRARLHEHPYCSATHPSACRFLGRVQAALMRLSVVIDAGVKRTTTTAPDGSRRARWGLQSDPWQWARCCRAECGPVIVMHSHFAMMVTGDAVDVLQCCPRPGPQFCVLCQGRICYILLKHPQQNNHSNY